ncbi:MAG: sulfotransferase [Georgfuchsia sp.]
MTKLSDTPTPRAGHAVIDVDKLLDAAREETGLSDFGDESLFMTALNVTVKSMNEESHLSNAGAEWQRKVFTRYLTNRLRLVRLLKLHPEIHEQEIREPVAVAGLQRSGTTKLFLVLGSDPQWLGLKTWEGLSPVPPVEGEADDRLQYAIEFCDQINSGIGAAHFVDPYQNEQESLLMYSTFCVPWVSPYTPTHSAWTEAIDFRPVYEDLKTQLQVVQWSRGKEAAGKRWILKTPSHLQNLEALQDVFPEIRLVINHRHPKTSVASMLRLTEMAQQKLQSKVDPHGIGRLWLHDLSRARKREMEFRDKRGESAILDVSFSDILNDSLGVVKRIYEFVDAPLSQTTRDAVAGWEQANPRGKHGEHKYALEDYGLTSEDIERAFAEYLARFGHLAH